MEVKPYTDEEIASVREAMRKRAVSACTPDHSRWLATLDEARAEVDSWRESSNAGWAKFDECRDDLKEARSEVARLRERVREVSDAAEMLCGQASMVLKQADLESEGESECIDLCRLRALAIYTRAMRGCLAAADMNEEGGE